MNTPVGGPLGSAKTAARAPVYTELAECQDCYKCIRHCPVKSIKMEKGQANILFERCIACGTCVVNCPVHAKHYRNDVEKVKLLLAEGRRVAVSLAPSFISEFSDWKPEELIAALKKLGFCMVSETALGADFLSSQVARDWANAVSQQLAAGRAPLMISSACPVIVEYIKLYAPRMAPYLSPYASPLLTHARFLRSQYTDTANVVFIGPCIAKKHEADLYNEEIDAALTFAELREWLEKERITPRNAAAFAATASAANPAASGADYAYCSFEPRRGARGTGFPMEGGEVIAFSSYIKEAAAKEGTEVHTISISGIGSIQETLSGFDPATLTAPLFLELLACSGGCVNGPGMTDATSGLIRQMRLQEYARTADKALDSALLLQTPPLAADYPVVPFEAPAHTEQEIASALSLVGKYSFADRLNCSSCGYDTCRDFAVALLDGRAEKSMCASYMRKLANKTANTLIKAIPSGVVIVDRNLKIIDCNEQFARLLGPEVEELYVFMPGLEGADIKKISPFPQYFQAAIDAQDPELSQVDVRDGNKIYHLTVFAVEKGVTVAGVVEDITTPRVRIETTVERAQELIRKNVSTVQQIAFLLGENAAESESILNSIIESYTAETEDV